MKNKILFTVTSLDLIDKIKGYGINKFVYPLTFFCVGIPKTFSIKDIKEDNAYLFINRVLDTKGINQLKETLKDLPSNIKGIIFDDLGILSIIKDKPIEKILYLSHFCTNYESINYYNEYVDSVIVSTDITEEEIDTIISKSTKKVSLFTFGLIPSFYSRRTLITSYNKHYNLDKDNIMNTNINDKKFISIENEYGTMMYHYPYFNGLNLLNKDTKYNLYFPILLSDDNILKIANNDISNIECDYGFLNNKTIYKLPPKEGR